MRILVIDRFEGTYAICEDKDQKFFAIETNELPAGATEGTVLEIDDEGVIHVNEEKTVRAVRRSKSSRTSFGKNKEDGKSRPSRMQEGRLLHPECREYVNILTL